MTARRTARLLSPSVAAASGALLLAACGGTEQAKPSATVTETVTVTAAPSESPDDETSEPEPTPEGTTEPDDSDDGVTSFGDHFEWEDGIQVFVSEPKPYRPSQYASTGKQPENLVVTIRIVNNGKKRYSPFDLSYSMQSGNREAQEIFDSPRLEGAPETTLLPGREVEFESGWNVKDSRDLVLEVSPTFDHEPMYFTTEP